MTHVIKRTGAIAEAVALALLLVTTSGCGGGGDSCGIATATLPDGTVGVPYSAALTSDCGDGLWAVAAGSLPPGVRLSEDGTFSGVPTLADVYHFTAWNGELSNQSFREDKRDFTITINDAP